MTSRKRNNASQSGADARSVRSGEPSKSKRGESKRSQLDRKKRRKHLLETLETRQLLAGPQLIGIQPNDGDLIVDNSVRDVAPRALTFRFDEVQQIDPNTFDGIRITRAGDDGLLETSDDVQIVPGLVSLGDGANNEVVVRFAESLPNDQYKAEVFGFDDNGLGIVGLRNQDGELFTPSASGQRVETTRFELRLGALIESVVPQPVVRNADGSLTQNRDEIVVYFNEDPLFVEDVSAQGTVVVGGVTISVSANLSERSFDDSQIVFNPDANAGVISSNFDADASTVTVTYPIGTTHNQIAASINSIDELNASVTQGNGNQVFVAPTDPSVRFEVTGVPSERSAENPRFYQLLLTQDTVRTTDDALYFPEKVIYDEASHTARLFFGRDLNELGPDRDGFAGVPLEGGTFRLRIGSAVDDRIDLILPPTQAPVAPSASSDFGIAGFNITFTERSVGEAASGRTVRFADSGTGNLSVALDGNGNVVFDFGGDSPTIANLVDVVASTPTVNAVITASAAFEGTGDIATELVPDRIVGSSPLVLAAVGDTLSTALDVGSFGTDGRIQSLFFSEQIDALPYNVELPGSNDDPGHRQFDALDPSSLVKHISDSFGPDSTDGITEIPYNFNGIFESVNGEDFLNQIDDRQIDRLREAVEQWGQVIGVQFRETVDEGITFAVGNGGVLEEPAGTNVQAFGTLGYTVRIDPTFNQSSLVFSTDANFDTAYGENFYRTAMTGIAFLLGLEAAPDLPPQTLMNLDFTFLNDSINTEESNSSLPPVFPGNFDVLHGQYLHRPDSIDVDLYRFEVDLGDPDRVGTLTAETFAERLADSSLLDTTLTLFEETQAFGVTDFGRGVELSVRLDAVARGIEGNNARIDFFLSDRPNGDNSIIVNQAFDNDGRLISNVVTLDLPRGSSVSSLTAGDLIDAINESPVASSIFRASLDAGERGDDIRQDELSAPSVTLRGGGVQQLSRNDDYFSEDSRIIASLSNGTYYVGVAASGNDSYDPALAGSGFGGLTQGAYDLNLKFEPQVDEADFIRDLDDPRTGVPGTLIDGDGDGEPGGVNNFWFQTRGLDRVLNFTENGAAVTEGQTIRVVGSGGVVRTYQFVPLGDSATAGNIAVPYNPGITGFATPAGTLAQSLANAITQQSSATGVLVTIDGTNLIFSNERSIELSDDFRAGEAIGRTIFVDKTAGPLADGSLERPFNNINNSAVANAFGASLSGDIVRIVGNGGLDQDLATEDDNFSYRFGLSNTGGAVLEDGRNMEVPEGVTTMIDAGAIIKLRGARVSVGSSTVQVNRSSGALQVLGTPRLVGLSPSGDFVSTTVLADSDLSGLGYDDGSVIFTSLRDRQADAAAAGNSPDVSPGDWGGLVFRRDLDLDQGRRDLEDEGIFLQAVNHAEIRYGGSSNILIDSVQALVNPVQLIGLRPTISFNEISFSADAAISASPNSFAEDSYQSPQFQKAGAYTADYGRIGPDVYKNRLIDNSVNGLFVRSETSANRPVESLTVAGRFDDTDIVHFLSENLVVTGTPGGSIADGVQPSLEFVTGRQFAGGSLAATGNAAVPNYEYRMTFVDSNGFESQNTDAADVFSIAVTANNSSVELIGLPVIGANSDYVSRRLYRALILDASGDPIAEANRTYELAGELDSTVGSFLDDGGSLGGTLDLTRSGVRGRLDGSLVFDPGLVLKLRGSRIELGFSTQLLAEGLESNPIVLTSSLDDRFGAGGTFDTNNDNATSAGATAPQRGDWSGIYAAPGAHVSLDQATVSYGGGISLLEGGSARGFAPVELQQASGRITNTRFEFNESGQDGSGVSGRQGRLSNSPSVIFVRGSQPTIVGNEFIDNRGSVVTINSEALTANINIDVGRQTGDSDLIQGLDDNRGPLIRRNVYDVVPADDPAERQLSLLEILGGVEITTESVFDDTDIVHYLASSLTVGNFHSGGGLRLLSRADESLVVKLEGSGNPNSATDGTGITATGSPSDIADRIGGSVQIIGRPGAPVVLTSINDDTVGAGRRPDGSQFTDSNGDSFGSRPQPNDWRSILLDQYSNDRNVDVQLEQELPTETAPGLNGNVNNAQFLGSLAPNQFSSDDQRRLGFEVEGFLSEPTDIDTYSFIGVPGTEVWIDIDRTSSSLDTVIELLDSDGRVLAQSDNSAAEIDGSEPVSIFDQSLEGGTTSLQAKADQFTEFGAFGQYEDFGSLNPLDAGIHFSLPGAATSNSDGSNYFFRIRSASVDPTDDQGGLTSGGYRFQVRLQEEQEFPGSVVRYSDIRFANHGVHVRGLPGTSPLLGEAQENESLVNPTNLDTEFGGELSEVASNTGFTFFGSSPSVFASNDQTTPAVGSTFGFFGSEETPFARPQNLGNLTFNKGNVISVGGSLSETDSFTGVQTNDPTDVDFYQFEVNANDFGATQFPSTVFDIDYAAEFNNRPDTRISVFFDPDSEFGPLPARLVYVGDSSNIAEDQPSPGVSNELIERLDRGSVSTKDPFIGPVSLTEGTYFVAVSEQGLVPSELLANTQVRREPIDSVNRIAVDRVEASALDTAEGTQIPTLFDRANAPGGPGQFEVTGNRSNDLGHGDPRDFITVGQTTFEFSQLTGDFGDSLFTGFDLDSLEFSITERSDIGGEFSVFTGAESTSTVIPHVTIEAGFNSPLDQGDVYRFSVTENGTRVILDVDNGFNGSTGPYDDDDDTFTFLDFTSTDVEMLLVNLDDGTFQTIDSSDFRDGLEGSDAVNPFDAGVPARTGLDDSVDPFFDDVLDIGNYAIVISPVSQAPTITTVPLETSYTLDTSGNDYPTASLTGQYTLHVSLSDRSVALPNGTNQSFRYNRFTNDTDAQLPSESFDLSSYSSADNPTFYFNYLFAPSVGGSQGVDQVSYVISSDQSPIGSGNEVSGGGEIVGDGQWRQAIVDLGDLAGQTGVTITFNYDASSGAAGGEGLYLDDFLIGFAERGEQVFFAQPGEDQFFNTGTTTTGGQYQLELRRGTEYTRADITGTRQLTSSFDTNARHAQAVTLIAPAASQLTAGSLFEISDGASRQTFQFEIDGVGGTEFNSIPIRISSTATSAEVAAVIRSAINQSTRINIEASTSGGVDTGVSSDNQLDLFGAVDGNFLAIANFADAPDEATALTPDASNRVQLPAVLFDGVGDTNYLRTQGQVIIEQNKISDARAIGIWSEAGDRDTDTEDIRIIGSSSLPDFGFPEVHNPYLPDPNSAEFASINNNRFLQLPSVGNPYPGAVRNLPSAQTSVLGGLAPGVVIRNNTIDQAGFSGIKTDGEARPIVITSAFEGLDTGSIPDGYVFAIDAGGTRVVFEFEDLAGIPTGQQGSGVVGGDGYADGHVPIFYRHNEVQAQPGFYNSCDCPGGDDPRNYPYSSIELMTAIHNAIQGSILVTNGLVELVDTAIGPDPFRRNRTLEEGFLDDIADDDDPFDFVNEASHPNAAVYVYGASGIYDSSRFQTPRSQTPFGFGTLDFSLAPISDPVQPVAQIVNNTIYGADGTESQFFETADREENDLLSLAIDTKVGRSHSAPYQQTALIEPETNGVAVSDVDFYRVELVVGDRLVVDIDTPNSDVDTVVQLFDVNGVRQDIAFDQLGNPLTFVESGTAPDHLEPNNLAFDLNRAGGVDESAIQDLVDADDPFVDFTAISTGTYFVAVSSSGNTSFDPNSLSGRSGGTGGVGEYDISLENYAPRSFVMSLDSGNELNGATVGGTDDGTKAGALIGATFTVTQIPDFAPGTPAQVGGPAQTDGNRITFEFTNQTANRLILPNGNINVPIRDATGNEDYRVQDIMRAIQESVRGLQDPVAGFDIPTIPNHENENGPFGRSGPVKRATATALGGASGDNTGIINLHRENFMPHYLGFLSDFFGGFGHDRRENITGDREANIIPQGTLTDGDGTTELYVLWENIAKIELSPEALAAGLKLTPDNITLPGEYPTPGITPPIPDEGFAGDADQLLAENGILIATGASPTVLNNVIVNTHQSIVAEESSYFGFGQRVNQDISFDANIKLAEPILAGNAFQYDESRNSLIRYDISFNIEIENPFDVVDNGLSTDAATGATNVASDSDDFNFVVGPNEPLLIYPAGNNFKPDINSVVIDSAINTLTGRDSLTAVAQSVGLPTSNIVAPDRDVEGVLRADNPNVAPPGGLGSNIFKDRGSNEVADFIGPVAILENPQDNDALGIDTDAAVSFLRLTDGTYREFRIQLQDNGDASDPFIGTGIDDTTVTVPAIDGLRSRGANVTIFEDDRLLTEGIDYTFNYDETRNVITLRPLTGIWRDDRSYRISLNNQDRSVLVSPDATEVSDGDQLTITDSLGGTLVFEFEAGYSLFAPEPITLVVPEVGTNAGGISDSDLFTIDDGVNPPLIFEFNSDGVKLPGTVEVLLSDQGTPTDPDALQPFLQQIAANVAAAIQGQVDAGSLDVDVRVIDERVVVGAERNSVAITAASGLQQPARTLSLVIPDPGATGIADGDEFVINNGNVAVRFEFDVAGDGLGSATNVPIAINGLTTAAEIALAVRDAIVGTDLGLTPSLAGVTNEIVYLDLPVNGDAFVVDGQVRLVGLSRTPVDGETLLITPAGPGQEFTFEINRTDERDANGDLAPDQPIDPNIAIDITRATTADELVGRIANAIQGLPAIAGLPVSDIRPIAGGILSIGGEAGLGISTDGSSLEIIGQPSVTGSSTIEVFGPLLLNLPLVGGGDIVSGSVLVLQDDQGQDVVFEFRNNLDQNPANVPTAFFINFDSFSTADVIRDSLRDAINAANIGITASAAGTGRVSLGRIDESRVNLSGGFFGGGFVEGLSVATLRRGIVNDAEVLTIQQGNTVVNYEFEAANGGGVAAGNVQVPFTAGSTVEDLAAALAATINNNKLGLQLNAVATTDVNGNLTGQVELNDRPGTIIDVSNAQTLNLVGVPGGATPVRISSAFSQDEIKEALISAINSVNQPGQPAVTTLAAENRGGATFFVSGASSFDGPIENFSLPAVSDLSGNALEPNRDDLSTQFTLLLQAVALDYGDAPDPVGGIAGRYPTLRSSDGARHVIDNSLFLGSFIDADSDATVGAAADGDDRTIAISETGELFNVSIDNSDPDGSEAVIVVQAGTVDPLTRDGDTITIDTGVATATLELDLNGRFDEDNFAISPTDPSSAVSITEAITRAIAESPLRPANVTSTTATVRVDTDDEDGVEFTSLNNPNGVINAGIATPIDVTVTGAGVLEAWIDFNADGDWDDPGEQIIPMPEESGFDERRVDLCPVNLTGVASNIFADTGGATTRSFCIVVPPTSPAPPTPVTTYARFRVSREGGLGPSGLALSGEVEDFAVQLVPGNPPQLTNSQANRVFITEEELPLQALDSNGQTNETTDDGLLAGIIDPDGDNIEIFAGDVGERTLLTAAGATAGVLDLSSDGRFTFVPEVDFFGVVTFTARVTDVQPLDPAAALVSSRPISVTINVTPQNDPPRAIVPTPTVARTIDEDEVQIFDINNNVIFINGVGQPGLIEGKFDAGQDNEIGQELIIRAVSSSSGDGNSEQGGMVEIISGGTQIRYTPPLNFNGTIADTFNYIVADVVDGGGLGEESPVPGLVSVTINAVNDAPIATDDSYTGVEEQVLLIPVNGDVNAPGILDNDVAGPPDELAAPQNQTITLVASQFPITSDAGGTVTQVGDQLRYQPPGLFSGVDRFTYQIADDLGEIGTAVVSINLSGENDTPVFVGINGAVDGSNEPVRTISRDESKTQALSDDFNLNTWFNDPDADALTFEVTSSDPAVAEVQLNDASLRLVYPPFGFGESTLSVTATDPSGASVTEQITVSVTNTPDPPSVVGSLNPLNGVEDQTVVANLGAVFNDPDQEQLSYRVLRLGSVANPTQAQIAASPLVESIDFVGDEMRITLKPDQSGSVDIEIAATDDQPPGKPASEISQVTVSFTLDIASVPDDPIAVNDAYNVPVGATLQIVDPALGLLRNDADADADGFEVELATVAGTAANNITLNSDGTFTFDGTGGSVGNSLSLTYRIQDDGTPARLSNTATVTFTFNQSRFQNPLADRAQDVNADGVISAIDALRVINFLARNLGNGGAITVPVAQIGAPPPDYYDVNGDGLVSATDALQVVNQLARINNQTSFGEGEFVAPIQSAAAASVTTSVVSSSTTGMPNRQIEIVESETVADFGDALDTLLTNGFEITSGLAENATELAQATDDSGHSTESIDEAIASIFDDLSIDLTDQ